MKTTYWLLAVLVLLMSAHSFGIRAQTISAPPYAVNKLPAPQNFRI